ncbi:uncharacterized protein KD926_007735 [Aspergillus affinis]|uniref:uncharacterized protein n=1 Tax=Aspergillus affinis TaxID=1070780 RepID=UPI0022FF3283|nr:uncharacterized protein KD926_007735 [Aspergillus affinis]KAI9040791.1 hypothetical protein KD926_007735 [Aspergillus affinis]
MHWNVPFIILASLLSPFISAVTIEHYRTGTCKGNHLTCIGIREFQCCNFKPNSQSVDSSALFRGLPRFAIGNVCHARGSNDCGSVQRSVRGLNQCAELANARGSFWFFNWQQNRQFFQSQENVNVSFVNEIMDHRVNEIMDYRDNVTLAYQFNRTVQPDLVNIEGHAFPLYWGTPENVTVALMEIFENDGTYEDIPEEARRWEIREEMRYEDAYEDAYEYADEDANENANENTNGDADGDADGGADGGTE